MNIMEFKKEYNLVKFDEEYIKLSPKEASILATLLEDKYNIHNYVEFGAKTEKDKQVMRTCVNRLNKKLGKFLRISAVTNKGYTIILYKQEE